MIPRPFQIPDRPEARNVLKKNRILKTARIIARNLPFLTTENDLKELFTPFGAITEIILLRNQNRPVGCGFIQFEKRQCASKAISNVSGTIFQGRPIILDWALPKHIFERANNIKQEQPDTSVTIKEESPKKGVTLRSSLRQAKTESKDEDLDSSSSDSSSSSEEEKPQTRKRKASIEAKQAFAKKPKPDEGISQGKTLFIKNIPFSVTSNDLKEYFSKHGPLEYALICTDPMTNHSRGSGFVQFKEKEHAENCLKLANNFVLKSQRLVVQLALKKDEIDNLKPKKVPKDSRNLYLIKEGVILAGSPAAANVSEADMLKRLQLEHSKSRLLKNLQMFVSPTRLVVHNLPPTLTDKGLWRIFKKHSPPGSVLKEAKIMRNMRDIGLNGTSKSKEFGFVSFTKHIDALGALRTINNNPDIFSDKKRPIVSFSIESKAALQVKEKRNAKVQAKKKESNGQENVVEDEGKGEAHIPQPSTTQDFHGVPAKFGSTRLRSKKELNKQAALHHASVKKEKKAKKVTRRQKRTMKSKKKTSK